MLYLNFICALFCGTQIVPVNHTGRGFSYLRLFMQWLHKTKVDFQQCCIPTIYFGWNSIFGGLEPYNFLNPDTFFFLTEVHVTSMESVRSCICVLGVSIWPIRFFYWVFETVQTVWYFLFFVHFCKIITKGFMAYNNIYLQNQILHLACNNINIMVVLCYIYCVMYFQFTVKAGYLPTILILNVIPIYHSMTHLSWMCIRLVLPSYNDTSEHTSDKSIVLDEIRYICRLLLINI